MIDLKDAYDSITLGEIVKYTIDKIEIKGLYDTKSEEDIDRIMNIDQLIQSVSTYEKDNPDSTLVDYIEGVTLNNNDNNDDEDSDSVSVSTVHASKGLEFDYVFVVGAEEGRFPLSRALDSPSELEEERRLMYVAITRAKKKLTITRAKSRFMYGERNKSIESRFLKEAGLSREAIRKMHEAQEKEEQTHAPINGLNIMQSIRSTISSGISVDSAKSVYHDEFTVGTKVIHTKLGIGVIVDTEIIGSSNYVSVDFGKPTGVKKLATKFAPIKVYKG
jgi:DNA helicase-2/ATP-dependent DNA helicase PcrA